MICLQERWWPIGKLFLGLWGYECYGGRKWHTPIYVRKNLDSHWYYGCAFDDNGHGTMSVVVEKALISNCHLSWQRDELVNQFSVITPILDNEIVCGDFNCGRDRISNVAPELQFVRKDSCDTFQNYKNSNQRGEIDHVLITEGNIFQLIFVADDYRLFPKVDDYRLSDHKPVTCIVHSY